MAFLRQQIKIILFSIKHKINSCPKLKTFILSLLSPFPTLKARLKNIQNHRLVTVVSSVGGPGHLPIRTRQIYFILKDRFSQDKDLC